MMMLRKNFASMAEADGFVAAYHAEARGEVSDGLFKAMITEGAPHPNALFL